MADHDILTLEEVADYLRVSERTVYDWANKGDIPCGKLGTTWRFKRKDVEAWVDRRLSSPKPGVVPSASLSLDGVLTPERVVITDLATKREVLEAVIETIATAPQVKDRAELAEEIFAREELMSTGIGFSVAVPHVRLESVSDLVMAVGVNRRDIEDYGALDEQPVRIICMLAARADQHAQYLKTLGAISGALKAEAVRSALIGAANAADAYAILTD